MIRGARRRFVDMDHGQVHCWELRARREADTAPLVMFHASPLSGRSLVPLATELAEHRDVFTVDLPGNGDSDPLGPEEPTVEDFAPVLAGVVGALSPQAVDVYGMHTGASMVLEMAVRSPRQVRNVVFEGVALFGEEERVGLLERQAPVLRPDLQGGHNLFVWQYLRDSCLFWPWWEPTGANRRALGLPAPEVLHERFVEVSKALTTYRESYRASMSYRHEPTLGALAGTRSLFVCHPTDVLRAATERAASLAGGELVELVDDTPAGRAAVIDGWLRRTGSGR